MEQESKKKFLSPENWLTSSSTTESVTHRNLLITVLLGIILIGIGVFYFKTGGLNSGTKVEVLNATESEEDSGGELTVEIAGEVVNPGVYKLTDGARVDDLLIAAGGFSADADRVSVEKYLNRAAKLSDGQKIYIASQSDGLTAKNNDYIKVEQPVLGVSGSGLTNINTSSLSELDKLPGIGPVYGQSIIDHRPYSNVEELLSKGALKKSVYEKIKDLVAVY